MLLCWTGFSLVCSLCYSHTSKHVMCIWISLCEKFYCQPVTPAFDVKSWCNGTILLKLLKKYWDAFQIHILFYSKFKILTGLVPFQLFLRSSIALLLLLVMVIFTKIHLKVIAIAWISFYRLAIFKINRSKLAPSIGLNMQVFMCI